MKRSWLRPICWLMGHEDEPINSKLVGGVEVETYVCLCCGRTRKSMREAAPAKRDVLRAGSGARGAIFPRHPERFDTGDVVLNTRTGEQALVRVRTSDGGLIVVRGHYSLRAPMLMCDELLNIGMAPNIDLNELREMCS